MKAINNNKGLTIPIVLIVLSIIVIFGTVTLSITTSQSRFNVLDDASQKALAYAEAGYNKYLWHLNDDLNFYSTDAHFELVNKPIEYRDGYYMLDVTKPSDDDRFVTIKSTGWTKENPDIKKTILAKIRKKQFVHHVYVSDNDGDNIWWTTGDESHGPLHTNSDIRIQKKPIFYDTVTYVNNLYTGTSYNPDFKVTNPVQPMKTDKLEFPDSNKNLKEWAEKDNMVFYGRTCIYLNGDEIKIRNQNSDEIITKSLKNDISNAVIYVDKVPDSDKSVKGGTGKFGIRSGNVFISGELDGKLTIGAEDSIYITYTDPTEWYDYDPNDIYDKNNKPNQPPTSFRWEDSSRETYPENGGIIYSNTYFSGNKSGIGDEMSSYDSEKGIYTRYSFDKNDKNKPGSDMLGLIANNDILILHYGWPKKAYEQDGSDDHWNFEWKWVRYWNWEQWKYIYQWEKYSKTYDVAPHDVTINAAIFSINGGFGYESYNKGPQKGNITIWGNITQRQRKPVGLIETTGYSKKYAHDPRMFYDYPPHILEPTNVGWEIHEWKIINE